MDREYQLQLEARLATVEFFLEVFMGQAYGYGPQDAQNEALASIDRIVRLKTKLPEGIDPEAVDFFVDMHPLLVEFAQKLCAKIERRANEIRETLEEQE